MYLQITRVKTAQLEILNNRIQAATIHFAFSVAQTIPLEDTSIRFAPGIFFSSPMHKHLKRARTGAAWVEMSLSHSDPMKTWIRLSLSLSLRTQFLTRSTMIGRKTYGFPDAVVCLMWQDEARRCRDGGYSMSPSSKNKRSHVFFFFFFKRSMLKILHEDHLRPQCS